ncbi:hypothetical protein T484DRAFT_1947129 [Baffinella frigidus]|nr:hypothetical protein T484DRAFT_1947129 [Cryptophyta sp. CCMP2293]
MLRPFSTLNPIPLGQTKMGTPEAYPSNQPNLASAKAPTFALPRPAVDGRPRPIKPPGVRPNRPNEGP